MPSRWSPWSAGCGSCGARWCFVRWLQFGQNLEELAHGVSLGHADILVPEYEEIAIPRPGLFLPRSAQVQHGQSLLIGQMVALSLDDDYLPGARSHDKIRIVLDKAIDGGAVDEGEGYRTGGTKCARVTRRERFRRIALSACYLMKVL